MSYDAATKACPCVCCAPGHSLCCSHTHTRITHCGERGEVVGVQSNSLEGAGVLVELLRQLLETAVLEIGLYDVTFLGLFLSLSILLEPSGRHPEDRFRNTCFRHLREPGAIADVDGVACAALLKRISQRDSLCGIH